MYSSKESWPKNHFYVTGKALGKKKPNKSKKLLLGEDVYGDAVKLDIIIEKFNK